MYKVKTKTWPKIVDFYRSLANKPGGNWLVPMVELVEQIGAADCANRVHGSTSHLQLRVSYLAEFDPDKEILNIDLDRGSGRFRFEYQETASTLYKRWKKTCLPNEAFPVLIRFLKLKKW